MLRRRATRKPSGDESDAPFFVGRYAIAKPFARGGVASVHLACRSGDAGFARTVAVKRLHPQHARNPDFTAMFVDEARLSAQVHHINVVSVHDVVAVDNELLLVMDYVHGVALAELLARSREELASVSSAAAVAIVSDVLDGLFAASSATNSAGEPLGLVHRDVSPQNILVGADGVCRVVDFGIARAHQRLQETKDGRVKGKAAYLSPEQLLGQVATPRSDQYACAAVLWEILAGHALHAKGSAAATAMSVLETPAPDIRGMRADVPDALARALARALSKDPAERFADAKIFGDAVRSAQSRASRAELASWVLRFFGSELDARARECESLERVAAPPPPAPRRTRGLLSLSAALLVFGAGVAATVHRGSAAPRASEAGNPPRSAGTASSTADPALGQPVVVDVSEPTGGASLATPGDAGPRDTTPRRVRYSSGARPVTCDPPWRYVEGIKRFKPECL